MTGLIQPMLPFDLTQFASPLMIIGGAHGGKSQMAHKALLAEEPTAVFGTADPMETAFKPRIAELKSQRPQNWLTFENNSQLTELIGGLDSSINQLLLDSLNQWVASRILHGVKKYSPHQLEEHISHEAQSILAAIAERNCQRVVIVTSEVAQGITPASEIPRLFRQMASRVNCHYAAHCASVILLSAGIPLVIKGDIPK